MATLIARLVRHAGRATRRAGDVQARAEAAQRRRDWVTAEALWRRVVQAAPGRVGAWVQLGNMLNELERRDEAVAAFREAGRRDPALAHAPAGVAGVHERAGRWKDAELAWADAIALIERRGAPRNDDDRQQLAHAYAHAAMSARHAGAPARARAVLKRANTTIADFGSRPENLALRASLLDQDDPLSAIALLRDVLRLLPEAVAASYYATSQGLRSGDLRQGLAEFAPALASRREAPAILAIALDLYEQVRLWEQAQLLAEWLAELGSDRGKYLERAFAAAAAQRNLHDARRIARALAAETGDLLLIHDLMRLYEDGQDLVRARLLCRWLTRRWPHSRWHVGRLIVLTAQTRSLEQADRLVRDEVAAGRCDGDVERAYCRAAFDAAHFAEAERRLEAYLRRQPGDEEMATLLGYALANAGGLERADAYFAQLAAASLQSLPPMVGMAHIAMRRRDLPAVADRWRRVATVHPRETVALVELARCAYEMRDQPLALRICETRLRAFPGDVTMGEFYAWLLVANGRHADAWAAIAAIKRHAGQSWALLELAIQCAGQLGTLRGEWPTIVDLMPSADLATAGACVYHVVRNLIVAGAAELIPDLLGRTRIAPAAMPWLRPYLDTADPRGSYPGASGVTRRWALAHANVSDDASRMLDAMDDADVLRLLEAAPTEHPVVHIVNKFEQPRGGSELHALDLAAAIGSHARVEVWAPETPHPHFTRERDVKTVDLGRGAVPRGGVLVLVGVYFPIASWIAQARPERVIFLYNTFEAPSLFARVDEVFRLTGVRAELLFCSTMMQRECGLAGRFEPSPTDLVEFAPATLPRDGGQRFTLGRHSRDVMEKHHLEDWRVYRAVADVGGRSRVLGGTCMRAAFPVVPGMDLLPARGSGIPDYLHGLDAFFYRTSTWVEPWGRVVIEAMACGLPVLAHRVGGYAQAIEHEVNGLLFDTTDEAVRLITRLAREPALRQRLGQAARRSVEHLLSAAEMRRLVAFYLVKPR